MNRTAYDYLTRYKRTEYKMLRLQSRKAALESSLLPGAIRYDGDKVQSSPDDRMAKTYERIEEIEHEIVRLSIVRHKELRESDEIIERIDDEIIKTAMSLYFVGGQRVPDIAKQMNYEAPTIYKYLSRGCIIIHSMLTNV